MDCSWILKQSLSLDHMLTQSLLLRAYSLRQVQGRISLHCNTTLTMMALFRHGCHSLHSAHCICKQHSWARQNLDTIKHGLNSWIICWLGERRRECLDEDMQEGWLGYCCDELWFNLNKYIQLHDSIAFRNAYMYLLNIIMKKKEDLTVWTCLGFSYTKNVQKRENIQGVADIFFHSFCSSWFWPILMTLFNLWFYVLLNL